MRKNTRRVLALVMALALILGNFTGLGTTAKAAGDEYPEVKKVSVSVSSISSEGGEVEVIVEGTLLPENLYYRIQEAIPSMPGKYTTIVDHTEVKGPGVTGGKIQIPIGKNSEANSRIIRVGVSHTNSPMSYAYSADITQAAAGGQTPTVDKTALEKAIKDAEACKQSDYTTEAWAALQSALANARKVNNDANATEQAVKDATKALNDAIAAGKPAVDDSVIKAKVVDEQGKPLSGIDFELIEEDTADTKDIPSSDEKGETEYSVKDAYDGEFTLTIHTTSEYTFDPTNGYTYHVAGGKVTKVTVDGKDYNEEIPTFTAKKIGGGGETDPQEPEASKKSLKINVVDELGMPVTDDKCKFVSVDPLYPKAEVALDTEGNGVFTATFADVGQVEAIIRLKESSKDSYEVTSAVKELKLVLNKGEIQTVNGEAYDGKKEYTFTVKKIGGEVEEEKGKITSAILAPKEFTAEGGEATLLVLGEKLDKHLSVVVKLGGQVTDIQAEKSMNSTDTKHSYAIKFPANETTQKKEYSVQCIVGASALENRYIPVTVAGKEEGGEGPTDPEAEAKITKITATPDSLPSKGGSVKLSVEGENLTADNWTAKAVGVLEGTDASRGTVNATDVTADGAIFNFDRNMIFTNRIQWTIQAGPIVEGEMQPQQEIVIYQDKNIKVETIDIVEASQPNGQTIIAKFEKDVKVAELEAEELGKLIHINGVVEIDGQPADNSVYYLQKEDVVTAEGNIVTIKLNHTLKLSAGAASIYFEQGSLKTTDGVTLKEVHWSVTSNPSIYSIDYAKDVFDYNGGTAVATLTGVRLDEVDLTDPTRLKATILDPQTSEEINLPLKIKNGAEPTITFTVPKNETDKTQTYLLSLELDGTPVYEGTGSNKAKRAIVSVLPKDADPKAPILGALTITGNGKVEGSTLTDLTVDVEKGLGQLKVELKLAGANFDSTKTEVRAIDENGVIWPVSHVPE